MDISFSGTPGHQIRILLIPEYLNESAVYVPTPLNPYDKIELGKSVFVFIPFCGSNFMWEA